ncbi:MAG: hypothetical protein AAF662_05370 [Pseudomonadota bacterium]
MQLFEALDVLTQELGQLRRKAAASSPEDFARIYLSHHFTLPPSRMHDELFELVHEATKKRAQRIAVAAPRGHANSTVVSLAYVLWSVLYKHESFVWLVSATREQAEQQLRHVRDELEANPRLLSDFPEVCAGKRPKPWRAGKI